VHSSLEKSKIKSFCLARKTPPRLNECVLCPVTWNLFLIVVRFRTRLITCFCYLMLTFWRNADVYNSFANAAHEATLGQGDVSSLVLPDGVSILGWGSKTHKSPCMHPDESTKLCALLNVKCFLGVGTLLLHRFIYAPVLFIFTLTFRRRKQFVHRPQIQQSVVCHIWCLLNQWHNAFKFISRPYSSSVMRGLQKL
jgi:hypothetical protein